MYACFDQIARMNVEDLREMRELGVDFLYTGLESGSDKVLKAIEKSFTVEDVRIASDKLHAADIGFASGIILGLGGVELSEDHISESIRIVNETCPTGSGASALNPQYGTRLYEQIKSGEFTLPYYDQIFEEERVFFEGLKPQGELYVQTGFFLPGAPIIGATLPREIEKIQRGLDDRERLRRAYGKERVCIGGKL